MIVHAGKMVSSVMNKVASNIVAFKTDGTIVAAATMQEMIIVMLINLRHAGLLKI